MNNHERWKQRFQKFEKAYLLINDDMRSSILSMSDLEKAGFIKHFEILFELSCDLMKDYLEYSGHQRIYGAKNIIRQAFQDELINDAEIWMDALKYGNQMKHAYQTKIVDNLSKFIENKFYPSVRNLYFNFKKEL